MKYFVYCAAKEDRETTFNMIVEAPPITKGEELHKLEMHIAKKQNLDEVVIINLSVISND